MMNYFNKIFKNLNIKIILFLDKKDTMNTRTISKHFLDINKNDIFWRIINLTDTSTVDPKILFEQYKDSSKLQIYNLSQRNLTLFSIPSSLIPYLAKTKLLII